MLRNGGVQKMCKTQRLVFAAFSIDEDEHGGDLYIRITTYCERTQQLLGDTTKIHVLTADWRQFQRDMTKAMRMLSDELEDSQTTSYYGVPNITDRAEDDYERVVVNKALESWARERPELVEQLLKMVIQS